MTKISFLRLHSDSIIGRFPAPVPVLLFILALVLCGESAGAAVSGPAVEILRVPGSEAVQAGFEFSGSIEVKTFYLTGPDRLVVDVKEAVFSEKSRKYSVGSPLIENIRIAQNRRNPDVVRIVFDLKKNKKPELAVFENEGRIVVREEASWPFPKFSVKRLKDRVELVLKFKTKPVFTQETVEGPPRFVLDFPNFVPRKALAEVEIGEGLVRAVRVSHFNNKPDITRYVVETKLPARIEVDKENSGKTIVVRIYQSSLYKQVIAVDPGHGGKDPGAQCGGLDEKEINLYVSSRLRDFLEAAGAKVVMTRKSDKYISLKNRAKVANRAGAKLFVSVHANALQKHKKRLHIRGAQMLHYSRSSGKFARVMQDELVKAIDTGDRGVIERKRLVVLRETRMKAVIAEVGFMTHPDELKLLNNNNFLDNAARGLFNGLEEFTGGRGLALASAGLPPEILAYLPRNANEYRYVASGNVLEKSAQDAPGIDGGIIEPLEPDFDDEWLFSEEGLTHEFGETPPADDALSGKLEKSLPASIPTVIVERAHAEK